MGRISMPQGKGSQMHNRRDYLKCGEALPEHIDGARTSENLTLVDRDLREAYTEIFGEALAEYNAKQKRSDRKIADYLNHIQKSKNGEKPFYEDIVQWGRQEDFGDQKSRQKAADALTEYVRTFPAANPNLKIIGAYIHMDEASPHLHLDYIPVATGFKRGMSVRNSLDRAMRQMGFNPEVSSRKDNATKLWKERERERFGDICRSLGLEVEAEQESRRPQLSVAEYKSAKDAMAGEVYADIDRLTKILDDDYAAVKQREAAVLSREQGVERREAAILSREQNVGQREANLHAREQLVEQAQTSLIQKQEAQAKSAEQLKNREEQASKKEAELEKQNKILGDPFGQISQAKYRAYIAEKDLAEARREIAEKEGIIERLVEVLSQLAQAISIALDGEAKQVPGYDRYGLWGWHWGRNPKSQYKLSLKPIQQALLKAMLSIAQKALRALGYDDAADAANMPQISSEISGEMRHTRVYDDDDLDL